MVVSLWGRTQLAERQRRHRDADGWGGFTLGYAVEGPEQVDALCAQAAEAGASVTRAPVEKPFGYSGVFADPDGHTWEVAYIKGLTLHADGTVALGARHDLGRAARVLPSLPGATETFPFEPTSRSSRRPTARCSGSPPEGRADRHQREVRAGDRRGAAREYASIVARLPPQQAPLDHDHARGDCPTSVCGARARQLRARRSPLTGTASAGVVPCAPMKTPRNPDTIHPPLAAYSHQIEISGRERLLVIAGQVGTAAGHIPKTRSSSSASRSTTSSATSRRPAWTSATSSG